MDISFYVLLTVACLVLLLAMWACAASNTQKWGPDLTLELPAHVLQQALFGAPKSDKKSDFKILQSPIPSAPSELASDPLLCNEYPVGISSPPTKYHRPPVFTNMDHAVQVLPTHYVPNHKLKPVFCFTTEEPA